jgi:predicted LPLAT superfamily acyltransferase
MHEGLSAEQSQVADAKLILLLANHVGDFEVLREAIALARQGL